MTDQTQSYSEEEHIAIGLLREHIGNYLRQLAPHQQVREAAQLFRSAENALSSQAEQIRKLKEQKEGATEQYLIWVKETEQQLAQAKETISALEVELDSWKIVAENWRVSAVDWSRKNAALEASMNSMAETDVKLGDSLTEAHKTISALEARIEEVDGQASPWPVMGQGAVAVGECRHAENDMPGLIYLTLDTPRAIGADTGDVYPVGLAPEPSRVLACVYFMSAEAIQQTIDVLLEIQGNRFPLYTKPITPQRELELLAVIEQKDEALRWANYHNSAFAHATSPTTKALALTPDLLALKDSEGWCPHGVSLNSHCTKCGF